MAINVPGDFLIFVAFIANVLFGILYLLVARGKVSFIGLAQKSYHLFTIATTLGLAYLFYLFFAGEYSVRYVYDYSDSSLNFFYTMSALWGGQEGTYLLWLFMNAVFGYILMFKGGRYTSYAMVIYSTVNLFFLFLLVKLSPFALLNFVPPDGSGLNPLLQDPWMVVHPPVIFVGYSMAAIPFALAMAALIRNDYNDWVSRAFPWAAITALMLAAGNILGGYWAYKTLGWGGFWAWDPVENSSFIPWFVSLAFIHGLILEKRSGALRKTNILTAAFVFVLVIYGTFLTRSGVLADFSVHSFVDLGINQYLVGFLALYTVMSIVLFVPRIKSMGNTPITYNLFHKEFVLFGGMSLLFLFSLIVLFWTSLPILTNIFTNEPRAADIATYNEFALPFAMLFSLFLTVAPFVSYVSHEIKNWQMKTAIFGGIGLVVGFGLFYLIWGSTLVTAVIVTMMITSYLFYVINPEMMKHLIAPGIGFVLAILIAYLVGVRSYVYLLYFGMAAMVVISNVINIFRYIPGQWKTIGAQVTHFGFGLMLIGILASSAYATNEKVVIPRGESDTAYDMSISYQGMENEIDYPHNRLILMYEEDGELYDARPELYFSEKVNGIMRKPYVQKNLLYDMYFSPEQVQELNPTNGIVLKKESPYTVGEYSFLFKGFEMGGAHAQGEGMTVFANIDLMNGADTSLIRPAVFVPGGETIDAAVDQPAKFGDNDQYTISILQILADQGAVAVDVPGLMNDGPPDRLIMDVSKKPIINFVWVGTTLILLGSLIVFYRRRDELSR